MKSKFLQLLFLFSTSISLLNSNSEAYYEDNLEELTEFDEEIYLEELEDLDNWYLENKNFKEPSREEKKNKESKIENKSENDHLKNLTLNSTLLNTIPGDNLRTVIKTRNVEIEFDGKFRIDFSGGRNTRFLNDKNAGLDSTLTLGKSTLDFNVGIKSGEKVFDRPVLQAALNMRNRATWGKPDLVGETTKTKLSDGDLSFGEHNHRIGIPMLYVRGFDLTLDLNALMDIKNMPLHFIKFGMFPFEIGRGISLGSAYAVTPDFITYDVANMIQEYAPGVQLYGSFDENGKYSYKAYAGILKNLSTSFNDINEPIRINQYGRKYNPQRGFGVLNMVGALQLDFNLKKTKDTKIKTSPYIMVYHEGEGSTFQIADATTELTTIGFDFSSSSKNLEFGFEFAKNFGVQNIKGIDKNSVLREQRKMTINGDSNFSTSVLTNSSILYVNDTPIGLDSKNTNALYFGSSDPRQAAINSVNQSSIENGKYISFDPNGGTNYTYLKNSSDRFRDPYQNTLQGFMGVADLTIKFDNDEGKKPTELSFAVGYASGDDNPNASLESKGDFAIDGRYDGFIGVQEIYSGKKVKSAFLLSGAGGIPRALSIPANDINSTNPIEYPSKVSRFTNIGFIGSGFTKNISKSVYNITLNPNLIYYTQATEAIIYDTNIAKKLGRDSLPLSLGIEANLFFEITNSNIDGLKFFGTLTGFIPGSYYSILKEIPLDKKQATFMNSLQQNKISTFTPTVGNDSSFYINIGIEFAY